jgi:hypothetical protein
LAEPGKAAQTSPSITKSKPRATRKSYIAGALIHASTTARRRCRTHHFELPVLPGLLGLLLSRCLPVGSTK